MTEHLMKTVGRYFICKYRARCAASNVSAVALQMRKQGVPIEIALLILTGRIP